MSEKISLERNKKYIKLDQNENTKYQNLWDMAKAVMREKFITLNAYIRKEKVSKQ